MKLSFLTLVFFLSHFGFGHDIIGFISTNEGKPINNVLIHNENTEEHSHSDSKGIFSLHKYNVGDSVIFTHPSYDSKSIILFHEDTLRIVLTIKTNFIEQVVIKNQINSTQALADIDFQLNPPTSSQKILINVPGLFIAQHAGGGKAEQIFLRGFDVDHGTDIAISVDGVPTNIVSHAHGQGYADLHYVIPETVEKIDFGKGPYYAKIGNFGTAGYIDLQTKKSLENSSIKLETGQFNTKRMIGLFNLTNSIKHKSYIASEYYTTDGAFESPQNLNRLNLFGKYSGDLSEDKFLEVSFSHFNSSWDASGQIPQRTVDDGSISRFGAIDDTEGGSTNRTNISLGFDKIIDSRSFLKNKIYYSNYNFELYSNFTFFLEDPINGDQIRQKEGRNTYGMSSEYNRTFKKENVNGKWQFGIMLRNDESSNNELSHTKARTQTLDTTQLGDINETNFGAYYNIDIYINKWTFNTSIRYDYFNFNYNDHLTGVYKTQTSSKSIVCPKLNILYNLSNNFQVYAKGGKGFHSNDTRVVVSQQEKKTLPAVYGSDLGLNWKPSSRLFINTAFWYLFMEQEFVYVGDAGIVEPSGQTTRNGMELSARYRSLDWLFFNFDINYTLAKYTEEPIGENYIPLAPDFTIVFGLKTLFSNGIYGGINLRHLGDRPANEDYTIVAKGYSIINLNLGYNWKNFDLGCQVENLFNTQWNESQFATTSQLKHETQPVEEIHFTPGTPFFIKASIEYSF